jgi:HKD family nuclease
MTSLIHHPNGPNRLGDLLIQNLSGSKWTHFQAAVAFVKTSGVKHIKTPLQGFLAKGTARICAGVDLAGTSIEGLTELLEALGAKGEGWVFHNEAQSTFHPKVYLFSNATHAECLIGSGNLTEGGLFTNYEAFVHLELDRAKPADAELLARIETLLGEWMDTVPGTSLKLSASVIKDLAEAGYLLTEAQIREASSEVKAKTKGSVLLAQAKKLFASVKIKPAPYVAGKAGHTTSKPPGAKPPARPPQQSGTTGFVITLQNTDVGHGQTTSGTSRRSPEIFLPKVCVHANPDFWGWPNLFKPDPGWKGPTDSQGYPKMDREGVRMRLGTQTLSVNWWYNPDKKDFRLRNEALRNAGSVGDILRIELANGSHGFDYYVEIIPHGTSLFPQFAALCKQPVRNSKKTWGYYSVTADSEDVEYSPTQ